MHYAKQSFKTAEESMFCAVALLKCADKATNHAMLLYKHIWHQQSDQFELYFHS